MNRNIWLAITAVLLILLFAALVGTQMTVTTVGGGVEGTRTLQARLQAACGAVVMGTPELRVLSVPPSEESPRWRWKIEATLRPGKAPGSPDVDRAVERIVSASLTSYMQGKPPGGVLLVLHSAGGPDWTRTYDGEGRPAVPGPANPAPKAPR
jgi:hypothetical protein